MRDIIWRLVYVPWHWLAVLLFRIAPDAAFQRAVFGLADVFVRWERDPVRRVYRLTIPDWALYEAGDAGRMALLRGLERFLDAACQQSVCPAMKSARFRGQSVA